MRTALRAVGLATVFVLAWIANPFALLHSNYEYGAAEMRAAVEGTWRYTASDGRTATLQIRQASAVDVTATPSLVKAAGACGSRELISPAEACIDGTRMPLHVVIVQPSGVTETLAAFEVGDTTFRAGWLTVDSPFRIAARIDPRGVASVEADPSITATLVRVALPEH